MSYKQFGKLGDIISNIQMVLKDELNSTKLTKSDINNLKKNVLQDLKLKKN